MIKPGTADVTCLGTLSWSFEFYLGEAEGAKSARATTCKDIMMGTTELQMTNDNFSKTGMLLGNYWRCEVRENGRKQLPGSSLT